MIPETRLSSDPVVSQFAFARALAPLSLSVDREIGGVALQDPSQGLLVQEWSGSCDGSEIIVEANGVEPTVVVSDSDITEFSFSFDQNMNIVVAYVAGGVTKLNWYDITVNSQITTAFGEGLYSPRVALDDKHPLASDTSDVIFAYIRDGGLYYRQQRDRYQTERLLAAVDPLTRLRRIGMNRGGRFQFEHYLMFVPEIVEMV